MSKKKMSLANLSKSEIKKNQMRDVLAGLVAEECTSTTCEHSGDVRAAGTVCVAICECYCSSTPSADLSRTGGVVGAIIVYAMPAQTVEKFNYRD